MDNCTEYIEQFNKVLSIVDEYVFLIKNNLVTEEDKNVFLIKYGINLRILSDLQFKYISE